VAVRARNAELVGGQGRRVTVPANDRVEVRFPAAARSAGTARFQVGAVSGRGPTPARSAAGVDAATTEAFATYGQIDAARSSQPVKAPPGRRAAVRRLEVTTSSTALQALTDAVLYLRLPLRVRGAALVARDGVAALRTSCGAFRAEGLPKPDEMVAAVASATSRSCARCRPTTAVPVLARGDESWPYVSIHVAHALQRAKEKGFAVPGPMLERSRAYLKGIDGHIPAGTTPDVRRALVAYASTCATAWATPIPRGRAPLVREAGSSISPSRPSLAAPGPVPRRGLAGRGRLLRRHLANRVTETAAARTSRSTTGSRGRTCCCTRTGARTPSSSRP
jgi:hypothetical protein